jgi:CheY-like chemotaxis protein
VSDTGIGIPAEKLELIFAPFSQADSSTTRKYGGTGLGLTISSRLVSMMGGKMWVESCVGQGTQFHFAMPLGVSEAKPIMVGAIAPPEVMRGVKVLVVDDNSTNRRILGGMLTRWEMRPTLVEGGEEAIVQIAEAAQVGARYGLILTDRRMPKMDGFELIERIRQRPELLTATIIMLTSAGYRGDAERCRELGVSAYLLKPIRQSELREAVAKVLGAQEQTGAIPLITRDLLGDERDRSVPLRATTFSATKPCRIGMASILCADSTQRRSGRKPAARPPAKHSGIRGRSATITTSSPQQFFRTCAGPSMQRCLA